MFLHKNGSNFILDTSYIHGPVKEKEEIISFLSKMSEQKTEVVVVPRSSVAPIGVYLQVR